jgi:hypothetical protein
MRATFVKGATNIKTINAEIRALNDAELDAVVGGAIANPIDTKLATAAPGSIGSNRGGGDVTIAFTDQLLGVAGAALAVSLGLSLGPF